MGRPAGSKNKQGAKKAAKKAAPKAPQKNQTESAPPREAPPMEAGPSNGPTAIEKRQYLDRYRDHRRKLASIMEDAADERGAGRSILKQFENKGGNPKMLKRMWELTDMTQNEATAEVQEYLGYAVDIGIRVSFDKTGQGGLSDILNPTTDAEASVNRARAYDEGWDRAKNGGQMTENPKAQGSEAHQQWHKGFSDYIWERDNPKSEGAPAPVNPLSDDTQTAGTA